jgi:hypothetical protein
MILAANSDCFPKHRWQADLCNGEVLCSLCGTDWILKYFSMSLTTPHFPFSLSLKFGFRGLPLHIFTGLLDQILDLFAFKSS